MSPQQCGERYLSPCAKRRKQSIPTPPATPSPWRRPAVYPHRSRGTQRLGVLYAIPKRFIPADAGNTGRGAPCAASPAVYPRRCGEHAYLLIHHRADAGLSPQVRGTLIASQDVGEQSRFIPAGAGNTFLAPVLVLCSPVYPRRCGEHVHEAQLHKRNCGLSPQVRGTLLCMPENLTRPRFIPAGAGNTWAS